MSGTFELHITDGNTLRSLSTLCRTFLLSGIKHYQISIECENVIRGKNNCREEDGRRLIATFLIESSKLVFN